GGPRGAQAMGPWRWLLLWCWHTALLHGQHPQDSPVQPAGWSPAPSPSWVPTAGPGAPGDTEGSAAALAFLQTGDAQRLARANCSRGVPAGAAGPGPPPALRAALRAVPEALAHAANFLNMLFQTNDIREASVAEDVEWYQALVRSLAEGHPWVRRVVLALDAHPLAAKPLLMLQATKEDGQILLQDVSAAAPSLGNLSWDNEWFNALKSQRTPVLRKRVLSNDLHSMDTPKWQRGDSYVGDPSHVRWSPPFLECRDGRFLPAWAVTLSSAFYGLKPDLSPEFKGVVRVDIELRDVAIDQCASGPGWFADTHRCDLNSTQCIPQESHGFVLGRYQCRCKPGFYGASGAASGAQAGGSGALLGCRPCRQGCSTCEDDAPCLIQEDRALRAAVLSCQACCMLAIFLSMLVSYRFRRSKRIRASGIILLETILFGSLLLYFPVFILYFKPSIFRCIVLRWVRMLGFTIVYGTITLKLYRVLKVFLSRTAQRVPCVSSGRVLKMLGLILVLVLWFLAAWTIGMLENVDKNIPLVIRTQTARGLHFYICGHDHWDYMMVIAEMLFLLWGSFLCYTTRTVPSAFHEPRYMGIALHNELMISATFHVVRFIMVPSLHPDWTLLLFFAHTHSTITMTLALLFIPKFLHTGSPLREEITAEVYEDELDMRHSGSCLNSSIASAWSEHSLDPDDIREELKKLYRQLEVQRTWRMVAHNPHLPKQRSSRRSLARSIARRVTELPEALARRRSSRSSPATQLLDAGTTNARMRDDGSRSTEGSWGGSPILLLPREPAPGRKMMVATASEQSDSESLDAAPLVCKSASAHNLVGDGQLPLPHAPLLHKSLSVAAGGQDEALLAASRAAWGKQHAEHPFTPALGHPTAQGSPKEAGKPQSPGADAVPSPAEGISVDGSHHPGRVRRVVVRRTPPRPPIRYQSLGQHGPAAGDSLGAAEPPTGPPARVGEPAGTAAGMEEEDPGCASPSAGKGPAVPIPAQVCPWELVQEEILSRREKATKAAESGTTGDTAAIPPSTKPSAQKTSLRSLGLAVKAFNRSRGKSILKGKREGEGSLRKRGHEQEGGSRRERPSLAKASAVSFAGTTGPEQDFSQHNNSTAGWGDSPALGTGDGEELAEEPGAPHGGADAAHKQPSTGLAAGHSALPKASSKRAGPISSSKANIRPWEVEDEPLAKAEICPWEEPAAPLGKDRASQDTRGTSKGENKPATRGLERIKPKLSMESIKEEVCPWESLGTEQPMEQPRARNPALPKAPPDTLGIQRTSQSGESLKAEVCPWEAPGAQSMDKAEICPWEVAAAPSGKEESRQDKDGLSIGSRSSSTSEGAFKEIGHSTPAEEKASEESLKAEVCPWEAPEAQSMDKAEICPWEVAAAPSAKEESRQDKDGLSIGSRSPSTSEGVCRETGHSTPTEEKASAESLKAEVCPWEAPEAQSMDKAEMCPWEAAAAPSQQLRAKQGPGGVPRGDKRIRRQAALPSLGTALERGSSEREAACPWESLDMGQPMEQPRARSPALPRAPPRTSQSGESLKAEVCPWEAPELESMDKAEICPWEVAAAPTSKEESRQDKDGLSIGSRSSSTGEGVCRETGHSTHTEEKASTESLKAEVCPWEAPGAQSMDKAEICPWEAAAAPSGKEESRQDKDGLSIGRKSPSTSEGAFKKIGHSTPAEEKASGESLKAEVCPWEAPGAQSMDKAEICPWEVAAAPTSKEASRQDKDGLSIGSRSSSTREGAEVCPWEAPGAQSMGKAEICPWEVAAAPSGKEESRQDKDGLSIGRKSPSTGEGVCRETGHSTPAEEKASAESLKGEVCPWEAPGAQSTDKAEICPWEAAAAPSAKEESRQDKDGLSIGSRSSSTSEGVCRETGHSTPAEEKASAESLKAEVCPWEAPGAQSMDKAEMCPWEAAAAPSQQLRAKQGPGGVPRGDKRIRRQAALPSLGTALERGSSEREAACPWESLDMGQPMEQPRARSPALPRAPPRTSQSGESLKAEVCPWEAPGAQSTDKAEICPWEVAAAPSAKEESRQDKDSLSIGSKSPSTSEGVCRETGHSTPAEEKASMESLKAEVCPWEAPGAQSIDKAEICPWEVAAAPSKSLPSEAAGACKPGEKGSSEREAICPWESLDMEEQSLKTATGKGPSKKSDSTESRKAEICPWEAAEPNGTEEESPQGADGASSTGMGEAKPVVGASPMSPAAPQSKPKGRPGSEAKHKPLSRIQPPRGPRAELLPWDMGTAPGAGSSPSPAEVCPWEAEEAPPASDKTSTDMRKTSEVCPWGVEGADATRSGTKAGVCPWDHE
uniref:G protein-coupled receptor 179 n=1 Tax=Strigops habroptila TaxID=2489341 RepID=A0A672U776_STRHB